MDDRHETGSPRDRPEPGASSDRIESGAPPERLEAEASDGGLAPKPGADDRSESGSGSDRVLVTRRRALQVLAAGAAGAAALPAAGCGRATESTAPDEAALQPGATTGGDPRAAGTLTDPDLVAPVVPWDLMLTDDELETLAALCDVIIPEDERSPSASALGAHEFIDEWVSAPYDGNADDRVLVRGGLVWLDVEAQNRFERSFTQLSLDQKTRICDDICYAPDVAPEFEAAARFFDRVRDLTSTAFWTTREGMDDLGFVGNRALPSFEGPPPEVLQRLGLA